MSRPRLVPTTIARIGRSARVVAAVGGAALVGPPLIGAVGNRFRNHDSEAAASARLGLGLGLGASALRAMLSDPAAAETEPATQTARSREAATGASGADVGASPGSWALDGAPDLLGLGGKAVSAGIDGAGDLARIAGHGVRGLVGVAESVGGAMPDLGQVAGAVVGAIGAIAAIGAGLGDFNL